MNSTEKGDKLENKFYDYLCDQKDRNLLVYEAYPPSLCKIYKKKKYYCKDRGADVEFDVVIEFYRKGGASPHLYIAFECKNHSGSIQERDLRDFSSKIDSVFENSGKGVFVIASSLQSGAEQFAKNKKLGLIKYDDNGMNTIAERKSGLALEKRFVQQQIFKNSKYTRSLKFSAYHGGGYFGSIDFLLESLAPELFDGLESCSLKIPKKSIPFIPDKTIQEKALELLMQSGYKSGSVDLGKICEVLSIDLAFTAQKTYDEENNLILGTADFDSKIIRINSHDNKNRERFTVGHEIGHFYLGHSSYLRSECILERDLFIRDDAQDLFNYEWLEVQANKFSSELLLPHDIFVRKMGEIRSQLEIKDRGHGYIFVDDQPCNLNTYNHLLSVLSEYFEASKQAIEIKLKKMNLLTDQRGLGRIHSR